MTLEIPAEVPAGQAEILVLVRDAVVVTKGISGGAETPPWEALQSIMREAPHEYLDAIPPDAAEQHDHYIYGTPKK
ncbi:MAG: hypothetical protein HZB26_07820 [Candidatus Hydrogenedentes bacterium]|nr:hypothetical protein [Candidatus Hydrogenedentota bacterium]